MATATHATFPTANAGPARAPGVLIVDDEPFIRTLHRRLLETAGYRVRDAASASEALRLLAQAPADVVVTDLAMPGLRGELFVEHLQRVSPCLPVVVCSGYVSTEVERRLKAAGVAICVRKPAADIRVMIEAVRSALATRPAESA